MLLFLLRVSHTFLHFISFHSIHSSRASRASHPTHSFLSFPLAPFLIDGKSLTYHKLFSSVQAPPLQLYYMAHLSHMNIVIFHIQGEIGTDTRYSTDLTAQILYVGYAFLVVILLSNVLIAIVTDSYEIIQNDRAAIVFWSNRLDFVAVMDAITYGINTRLGYCRRNEKGAPGTMSEVQQEGLNSPGLISEDSLGAKQPFREAWKSVMFLFDANLYEEIDWLEFFV
jgi:hypothetical protein